MPAVNKPIVFALRVIRPNLWRDVCYSGFVVACGFSMGFDSTDEDGKKKMEEFQAEFEPLSKLLEEVLGDKVEKVKVESE